jgi:hypothetical protein
MQSVVKNAFDWQLHTNFKHFIFMHKDFLSSFNVIIFNNLHITYIIFT